MKGPRELKRFVAKHRDYLVACRWDDLLLFKLERCKNWYKRNKRVDLSEF